MRFIEARLCGGSMNRNSVFIEVYAIAAVEEDGPGSAIVHLKGGTRLAVQETALAFLTRAKEGK